VPFFARLSKCRLPGGIGIFVLWKNVEKTVFLIKVGLAKNVIKM
jgi:hypothetical protein